MGDTRWKIVGASVTGTSHLKYKKDCDDAHAFWQDDEGTLLLVVADGAGSARYANKGARIAVTSILESNKDLLGASGEFKSEERWKDAIKQMFVRARSFLELSHFHQKEHSEEPESELPRELGEEEIVEEKQEGPGIHDFATTLLVALLTPQGGVAAQIGDGAIVIQLENDELNVLIEPEHGEYLNQTNFLTDDTYLEHIEYASIPEGDQVKGIALLTDGLENLALDFASKKAHVPFFAPLLRFARSEQGTQEELEGFLRSERVCKQTDDDKTLLLAVRL